MVTVWRSLTSIFRGRAPHEPSPNDRAWVVARLLNSYVYNPCDKALDQDHTWQKILAALGDAKRAAPQRFQ